VRRGGRERRQRTLWLSFAEAGAGGGAAATVECQAGAEAIGTDGREGDSTEVVRLGSDSRGDVSAVRRRRCRYRARGVTAAYGGRRVVLGSSSLWEEPRPKGFFTY